MSVHSLHSEIGIGSRLYDLLGKDFKILRMSSSDTGSREDRALLLLLSPVAETGANDCSATQIFIIFSLKKCLKVLVINLCISRF